MVVSNIEEALRTSLCPSEKNSIKIVGKNIKFGKVKSKLVELCLQTECENGDTKLNLKTSSVYYL